MQSIGVIRGVEHVALVVPDIDQAVKFFVDALDCELYYEHGPYADPDPEGTFMADTLAVHPRAAVTRIAMLRCGNSASFELLQWESPDQLERMPKASDWGATHIAFYVDDLAAAVARVKEHGARVLFDTMDCGGPEAGEGSSSSHFLTPWGQDFEFVTYPNGRDYMSSGKRPLFKPEPAA